MTSALTRTGAYVLALLLAAQAVAWMTPQTRHWWFARTQTAQLFHYESVEYGGVASQADGIEMISTSVWHRKMDHVTWVDVLRCETSDGDMGIYSSQESSAADIGPRELKAARWFYTAGHPSEGRCRMHSTITIDVDRVVRSQLVETTTFNIQETS